MAADPDPVADRVETPLDHAHAAMVAAGETEPARRVFFAALAATELHVPLRDGGGGGGGATADGTIRPLTLDIDGGPIVLAFDTELRLATFTGGGGEHASLPGRALAQLLSTKRLGLGLNLEAAPSAMLLPAAALGWLAESAAPVSQTTAPISRLRRPDAATPDLLAALDAALARATGRARAAALVGHGDALTPRLLIAIEGAAAADAPDLAALLTQTAAIAAPNVPLDVSFLDLDDPMRDRIRSLAVVFDLPDPAVPMRDPDRPPRLR
ncbi:MAG: SseB family protein [Pseudomonadota bacterium]